MIDKNGSIFKTFFIKGTALDYGQDTSSDGKILTLNHPKKNTAVKFYLIDNMLHELMYTHTNSSCFIDETVHTKGKYIFSGPIDPIFMVLPYLKARPYDYIKFDELLTDKKFPDLIQIKNCIGFKYLHFAVDKTVAIQHRSIEPSALIFVQILLQDDKYKYNEDKILEWLNKKYDQLMELLERKRLSPDINLKKEVDAMISQYLEPQLYKMFVSNRKQYQKRKSTPASPPTKKD